MANKEADAHSKKNAWLLTSSSQSQQQRSGPLPHPSQPDLVLERTPASYLGCRLLFALKNEPAFGSGLFWPKIWNSPFFCRKAGWSPSLLLTVADQLHCMPIKNTLCNCRSLCATSICLIQPLRYVVKKCLFFFCWDQKFNSVSNCIYQRPILTQNGPQYMAIEAAAACSPSWCCCIDGIVRGC